MKPTTKKNNIEQAVIPMEETCLYCGRVQWGNVQYLFKGWWRHAECAPGSEAWCEWYDRHPEKRTEEGQAIRAHSKKGKEVSHG